MTDDLEIHKLERKILELEVSKMLLALVKEVQMVVLEGKVPDTDVYAKKIIAFLREHLVD
jgi:hypothetical protein